MAVASQLRSRLADLVRRTPPRQWPPSTCLLAAFGGASAVAVVLAALGGTRQPTATLVVYATLVTAVTLRSTFVVAPCAAVITWMVDNGFLVNRYAHLVWHGSADGVRFGVLLGAAGVGVVVGWARGWASASAAHHRRAAVAGFPPSRGSLSSSTSPRIGARGIRSAVAAPHHPRSARSALGGNGGDKVRTGR